VNVTLTGGKRKVCVSHLSPPKTTSDLSFADEPQPNLIDNLHLDGETGMALLYKDKISLDWTWDWYSRERREYESSVMLKDEIAIRWEDGMHLRRYFVHLTRTMMPHASA
jgi:hypothetical protein